MSDGPDRQQYEFELGWDRGPDDAPAPTTPLSREDYPGLYAAVEAAPRGDTAEFQLPPAKVALEARLPIDPDDEWTDAAVTGLAGRPFRFHGREGTILKAERRGSGIYVTIDIEASAAIVAALTAGMVEGFSIAPDA